MSLRTLFAELGPVDGGLYGLGRVLKWLTGERCALVKYYFFAQPIGAGGAKPMRSSAGTVLRRVEPGDPSIAQFPPRPAATIAQRYASGAVCTAAFVHDEFAGFIWIQRGRYDEDELRCAYLLDDPVGSVWDYDVYVEPRFRLGRTMARLWSHVDAELAATGVRWSFSRISAFNPASLASHRRLGIVCCGSALFLKLGSLQVSVLPAAPYLHFCLGAGGAPAVRLRPPG